MPHHFLWSGLSEKIGNNGLVYADNVIASGSKPEPIKSQQ